MSLDALLTVRNKLISSSDLTALVPASQIKVGWQKTIDSFPCIIINQAAGNDVGYLGYAASPSGNKVRREQVTVQIDIYSRKSRQNVFEIADEIVPLMISLGSSKDSDVDDFNDDLSVYRKIQTYTFFKFHDD